MARPRKTTKQVIEEPHENQVVQEDITNRDAFMKLLEEAGHKPAVVSGVVYIYSTLEKKNTAEKILCDCKEKANYRGSYGIAFYPAK